MVEFLLTALKLALFHAGICELLKLGAQPKRWHWRTMLASMAVVASIWLALQVLLALLLLWPIRAVQQTQSVWSALALSVGAGLLVLGLQRIWPMWRQLQQDFRQRGNAAVALNTDFWRSALAAACLLLLAAPALLQAVNWVFWPKETSLWLLAYGVLALMWHALAIGQAPESKACEQKTEDLAKSTAPILQQDPDSALLQAVHNGQIDSALLALEAGANPHQLPSPGAKDQRSLMMIAATLSDLRLLRALIGGGVDVNAFHAGLNPLLSATRDSWHGRSEAVTMLLTNGARSDVRDSDGNTPLHHAMRSTDAAVAALLLDAGASIEAVNNELYTPLALACQAANWRVARYMLERKAKLEPAEAIPVLIAAASAEDDDIGIRLLHKHKAKIDIRGPKQRTALMLAAQSGLPEVVSTLLELGAQINAVDETGMSAYMLAARAGEVDVLRKLREVAKLDRDHRDLAGLSALDHALANGRWSAVACIDPNHAVPEEQLLVSGTASQSNAYQQLLALLSAGDFANAEQLLQAGLQPASAEWAELLVSFTQREDRGAMLWLCRHGAHIGLIDHQGQSVYASLLQGLQSPLPALVFFMQQAQSVVGAGTLAAYCEHALQFDFSRRQEENMALYLLQQGADPFGVSPNGVPALVLALRLHWSRLAETLLAVGVDANASDRAGLTALHVASQFGHVGLLKTLIAAGADPERRSLSGQSALGIAAQNQYYELQAWLHWPHWPLPGRRLCGRDLPEAVQLRDSAAVEKLLALGIPLNTRDSKGSSALIHACGQGQKALVERLLVSGADPSVTASSGATALWAAISQSQREIVQLLLQHGASVHQSIAGYPPLHLACLGGHVEVVSILLAHAVDCQALDGQQQNALHAAAGFLSSENARIDAVVMIDSLLRAEIRLDAVDKHGQTPLHILCGAGLQKQQSLNEPVVLTAIDRLLQEAPLIDALDSRGFTALHHAAARGYSQICQRLLRAGASRSLRDNLGRSAFDFAVMGGFTETANVLQERPERIDIASLLVKKDQA